MIGADRCLRRRAQGGQAAGQRPGMFPPGAWRRVGGGAGTTRYLRLQLSKQLHLLSRRGGAEEAVLAGIKLGGHLLHLGTQRGLVCDAKSGRQGRPCVLCVCGRGWPLTARQLLLCMAWQRQAAASLTRESRARRAGSPTVCLAAGSSSVSRGKSSSSPPVVLFCSDAARAEAARATAVTPAEPSAAAAAEAWEWAGEAGAGGVGAPSEPGREGMLPGSPMGMAGDMPPA